MFRLFTLLLCSSFLAAGCSKSYQPPPQSIPQIPPGRSSAVSTDPGVKVNISGKPSTYTGSGQTSGRTVRVEFWIGYRHRLRHGIAGLVMVRNDNMNAGLLELLDLKCT